MTRRTTLLHPPSTPSACTDTNPPRRPLLRTPTLADTRVLSDFFDNLSPDSRYHRFFGPLPKVPSDMVRALATDTDSRHNLVVLSGGEIIGHGTMTLDADNRSDLGIAVADHCRRSGVATFLVHSLVAWARERGSAELSFEVLWENRAAMLWAHTLFPQARFSISYGIATVNVPIAGCSSQNGSAGR